MQIIPAIDIIDGKCVRLREGDYTQKTVYDASPLEMARIYEEHGIRRVHLVDLDGAKAGKVINWSVAEKIAANTKLSIDFGGGVKTKEEVSRIFSLGISFVTVGSMAVKQPEVFMDWVTEFGSDHFMLGADVRDRKIMVSGWLESSDMDIIPFLKQYLDKGVVNVFCTDISKDGRLEGPAVQLYAELKKTFPQMFLIASGGVADIEDLAQLSVAGCDGVIIGKAIYEKKITLKELEAYSALK